LGASVLHCGTFKYRNGATEMKKSLRMMITFLLIEGTGISGNGRSAHVRPPNGIATPVPTASGLAFPDTLGYDIHFTEPQSGELKLIRDSGVRWIRMDVNWQGTERTAGVYDFSPYDRLLSALDQYQLKALLILCYGNPLYDKGAAPTSDAAVQAFARWAAAAVSRFKGRGVVWELWNEPQASGYPSATLSSYTKLGLATGAAIKDSAPNEQFIGPATAGADVGYAVGCLRGGMSRYWTAVSIHPYQATPEAFLKYVFGLKAGVAPLPLYSTEWGYSTAGGPNYDVVPDEETQAKYLAREFLLDTMSGIGLSIWYDWRDDGADPKNKQHHFGVVHQDLSLKPAYTAAKTLTSKLEGYAFSRRLSPARTPSASMDYVLAFEPVSGSAATKYVVWTTTTPHNVSIPAHRGQVFHQTSYMGEGLPDVTAGGKSLDLQLTDAPFYLEPAK
jgi:polysaccharide biosynthesis protein PslG